MLQKQQSQTTGAPFSQVSAVTKTLSSHNELGIVPTRSLLSKVKTSMKI